MPVRATRHGAPQQKQTLVSWITVALCVGGRKQLPFPVPAAPAPAAPMVFTVQLIGSGRTDVTCRSAKALTWALWKAGLRVKREQ